MSALDELLSFAYKEEKRKAKDELAKQLLPLWLVKSAPAIIRGEEVPISFSDFIDMTAGASTDTKPVKKPRTKRSPEEIEAEFMPIVRADRQKGG